MSSVYRELYLMCHDTCTCNIIFDISQQQGDRFIESCISCVTIPVTLSLIYINCKVIVFIYILVKFGDSGQMQDTGTNSCHFGKEGASEESTWTCHPEDTTRWGKIQPLSKMTTFSSENTYSLHCKHFQRNKYWIWCISVFVIQVTLTLTTVTTFTNK